MDLIKLSPLVKLNQEEYDQEQSFDQHKQQNSANTEVPEETKIKLETKIPYQKKQESPEINEHSLFTLPANLQNQLLQARQERQVVLKRRRRNLSHHERLEDVRLVASHFIEHGLNFRKFNQYYPDIDSKFYRNTVEAINNTALNQIEKYLRYQCNIQIEKLNRDQKRSIRTQLTKVRQWLGKKDVSQLQTLYKFIQRKYQLVDVDISIEEGLKFYKTILQIVKSPFVDVMEDDIKPQTLDPQINKQASLQEKEMQEKTLIFLYIQHKNLTKVSDLLCEKFGYTIKWSKHAVKQKIKFLLKMSLKKLIGSVEAYDKTLKLFFSESQECVEILIKSENSLNLKVFLLGFYLQKTITLIELREYIRNINKFFIQEYKGHGQYECKQFEENVKIPKLQIKGQQSEKIITEVFQIKKEDQKNDQQKDDQIKEQRHDKADENQEKIKFNEKEKPDEKKEQKEYILVFEECIYDSSFQSNEQEEGEIKLES